MNTNLESTRGRAFFWLGLTVLPVFWIWWMTPVHFTSRQIRWGRVWTMVYMAAFIIAWFAFPTFQARLLDFRWTYGHVSVLTGLGLCLWLLFRVIRIRLRIQDLMVTLFLADVMSLVTPGFSLMLARIEPRPATMIFVIIPAVAHLLVEPLRRWNQ
ncbi:MAG: hypothetical protein JNM99_03230 [Verrucomicrobiaceae bacterium]|nr:hypothetical protein [Verrucomicrobiaceae bacterium]